MKNFLNKIKVYILKHKVISLILIILVVAGGYMVIKSLYATSGSVSYTTEKVSKGVIISSVSGSGQVSALNQVEINAKASGDITYLNIKSGEEVRAGDLLAQGSSGDAFYEYESAKISYDELIKIDPNDLKKAENSVSDSKRAVETAYSDARVLIIKASSDFSDNLNSIKDLLDGYLSSVNSSNSKTKNDYVDRAGTAYYSAQKLFSIFMKDYKSLSDGSSNQAVESLVSEAVKVSGAILEASKNTKDAVVYVRKIDDSTTDSDQYYETANTLVVSSDDLFSNISSAQGTIINKNHALEDAITSLQDIKDGPDVSDLRSRQLSLSQKADALEDYSSRAPFDGVIASVNVKKGDSVNTGTNIATIITKQKIAEISLNEVDVAKVKIGQKTMMTFDAIPDLTISGYVAEINMVGTVNQGVVNYDVKISFDIDDERVKPGMSVSTSIITDVKQDVLTVPNAALKLNGNNYYVEIPATSSADLPIQQEVEVGVSNDTLTEIISGLKEGDTIITKTSGNSIKVSTAQAPSLFGSNSTRQITR